MDNNQVFWLVQKHVRYKVQRDHGSANKTLFLLTALTAPSLSISLVWLLLLCVSVSIITLWTSPWQPTTWHYLQPCPARLLTPHQLLILLTNNNQGQSPRDSTSGPYQQLHTNCAFVQFWPEGRESTATTNNARHEILAATPASHSAQQCGWVRWGKWNVNGRIKCSCQETAAPVSVKVPRTPQSQTSVFR